MKKKNIRWIYGSIAGASSRNITFPTFVFVHSVQIQLQSTAAAAQAFTMLFQDGNTGNILDWAFLPATGTNYNAVHVNGGSVQFIHQFDVEMRVNVIRVITGAGGNGWWYNIKYHNTK